MGIVLYILAVFFAYQILIRIVRKIFHFPAPAFIGRFLDSNIRSAMQPAAPLIRRSGIQADMKVLEIGCWIGAYTPVAVTEWLFDPDYRLKRRTVRILAEAGFSKIESTGSIWTYTVRGHRE
ncbi:MAG TPA: hypothetical protein VMX75_15585 [Spirochaetia bacterium]|nr:hypothetical protein [Spirochaetia bacterium]